MTEPVGGVLSPVECVVILAAIALVVVFWLPAERRRPVAIGAVGSTVAAVTVLFITGVRWPMVPILACVAVLLPFTIPALRRGGRERAEPGQPATPRRARWRWALPASAVSLGLIAGGLAVAWAFPVPVFPEPTGPFAVGTTVMQWTDLDRAEPATANADRRQVVVQLWYPARAGASGAQPAVYAGRSRQEAQAVAAALAQYAGLPAITLDNISRARTHALPDAPVADEGGRFPVVLFSPGLGGVRTQNTALAEDLASRGYVVAGLDHPYDSAAVVLTDGRVIRTRVTATGDAAQDERLAAGWTAVRASDLSFVLTQLGLVDQGGIVSPLASRIDTDRAAVVGHSIGGAAALQAAQQDPRFVAVVNLDGFPHGPAPQHLDQPVLALTHPVDQGQNPDYLPRLARVLERSGPVSYQLTVVGSAHLSFTDAPLFLPPWPALVGSLRRGEAVRATTTITAAFLDQTLRHQPRDLAPALSAYGELTVYPGYQPP